MDVKEHFYTDDPAAGPADVRTNPPGIEYYFLGNGHIQAAVQVCPDIATTPLGLLLMRPGRFGPKRAALTFDQETGLRQTMIRIHAADRLYQPRPGQVDARWTDRDGVPAVRITWRDGAVCAEETLYCPDRDTPTLAREIRVRAEQAEPDELTFSTGPSNRPIETTIPGRNVSSKIVCLTYRLQDDESIPAVIIEWCEPVPPSRDAVIHAQNLAACRTSSILLDHLYAAARNQLPAVLGTRGQMDGSIWQYNHEWIRDQAMVARSLAMLGETGLARAMLDRLLAEFVTQDGATVDSDVLRDERDVELDQNGELLFALKAYVDWTGDETILHEHWDRIAAVAEFPLRDAFRHDPSGLLHNEREYWERHALHGIEDGMDVMNQFFHSIGLFDAAALARLVGRDDQAQRSRDEADRLRRAMLHDQRYGLVHDGRLIKRRALNGDVQETITAPPGVDLPDEVPLMQDGPHRLNPDASTALPVAMEFIDPADRVARRTLDELEQLWNQAWNGGGYGRYHVTSEADSPGSWPFPSLFIARAYFETGDDEKVWRILHWLASAPGGKAGSWFEFYGPRPIPPYPQIGIVPWTWAELIGLFIHHLLGVRPFFDGLVLRPRLLRGLDRAEATLPLRGHRLHLVLRRAGDAESPGFHVDGVGHDFRPEGLRLLLPSADVHVEAVLPADS
ncbi:MAG: hypothetical protein SYC29_09975 [Planctomycetota bacterium]|nr:hypothetical protein [Planctomycetota bacterium]